MASVLARALRVASLAGVRAGINVAIPRALVFQPSVSPKCAARTFSISKTIFNEQPRLRLGSPAPNFQAETTHGPIDFHEFIGDSWTILFSHPADFTPVCTTELGAFAQLEEEFKKRNTKLIGLSANGLDSHEKWIDDIEEVATNGSKVGFPIIADPERNVAFLYDMVDHQDLTNIDTKGIAFTIRAVFIIDPNKKVRLTMLYPASTGRNTAEVLRVLDSLQTGDKAGVTTPINWVPGQDVIVPPSVSDEAAAAKFGEFVAVKPYLRYTKYPADILSK
ncbi:thioredoxin-like protein [Lipomyces tetrasporus]|uniref:Thioredoxin-like protein n=1 Tax=Lipomyces tetrasporus TaxID=54092 RepID=A0AAD7QU33_9ASCO|nr:thioredoxin-like protein [Lipomyces tetrasporus]KAJ8101518.1 thioredoxin-like protein [Lipomyces tetrasporus]